MPECSNPVQCQLARRTECTCACQGANHGILRGLMESPDTRAQGEQQLEELKAQQAELKRVRKKDRWQRRAAERKVLKEG